MADEAKTSSTEAPSLKGLLGTKIGMTRIFVDETHMVPVTVISAEGLVVSQVKSKQSDGYNAVQVGYGNVLDRKISKAENQHFKKKELTPKRHLGEFRVSDSSAFKAGQAVSVAAFTKGELVKVSGYSKGKGYAGVVKRHGFGGLPFSHGHGEYRNRPGSSGAQGPQHVLPGTKKPGHLGHIWKSATNVEVVDVDVERNLILVKGSIPGPNGNFVVVRPAKKAASQA